MSQVALGLDWTACNKVLSFFLHRVLQVLIWRTLVFPVLFMTERWLRATLFCWLVTLHWLGSIDMNGWGWLVRPGGFEKLAMTPSCGLGAQKHTESHKEFTLKSYFQKMVKKLSIKSRGLTTENDTFTLFSQFLFLCSLSKLDSSELLSRGFSPALGWITVLPISVLPKGDQAGYLK